MTLISWKHLHPERFRQASERQAASAVKKVPAAKKQTLTGRAGKDALLRDARELAQSGVCRNWDHVLDAMHAAGTDIAVLSIWATRNDKDEIDHICARTRGAVPKHQS